MTVIAIDGPAGSGKSTLAALLSKRLGYAHLDTGAMYRAVTLLALRQGVPLDDGPALAELARSARLTFTAAGRLLAQGEDVSEEIRRPAVSAAVSQVSAHPEVREVLVAEQRRLASEGNVVMEGRDIGTVVCPTAAVKIFLVADSRVRADRRQKELLAKGERLDSQQAQADIEARDRYDSSRPVAPLKAADDAVVLDSTELTIDEMVALAESIVRERMAARAPLSERGVRP